MFVLGAIVLIASVIAAPANPQSGKPEPGVGALVGISAMAVGAVVMVVCSQHLKRSIRQRQQTAPSSPTPR